MSKFRIGDRVIYINGVGCACPFETLPLKSIGIVKEIIGYGEEECLRVRFDNGVDVGPFSWRFELAEKYIPPKPKQYGISIFMKSICK